MFKVRALSLALVAAMSSGAAAGTDVVPGHGLTPASTIRRSAPAYDRPAIRAAWAGFSISDHRPANVNLSRHPGSQSETAVAINPADPDNVVVTSNLDTFRGLFEAVTFDGGKTWSRNTIALGGDLRVACCDSSLAFDEFGNLFLTYLWWPNAYVPVALSTDGGLTFDLIAVVVPRLGAGRSLRPRQNGARVSTADQPTVTTGPGSVWVTFTGGITAQAAGAAVAGPGRVGPFGTPEVAAGQDIGHFGDVAVGPSGQVMITYQDQSGEGPGRIFIDLDPDGLGSAGFEPARLVTRTGVGDFDAIPAQPRETIDAEIGLAWDRSGGPRSSRVYLLWTAEAPNESDDTDVMVQFSDDLGTSWSSPRRVNDDAGTNSQFNPKVALDQATGDLAVTWYDCRYDLGQGGPGDTNGVRNDDAVVFAALSRDGAATFSSNFRLGGGPSNAAASGNVLDFGDYEGLAFHGGRFYPAWADNSNSTHDNPDGRLAGLDIYSVRVDVS